MEIKDSVYLENKEGYDQWSSFYDGDDIPLNLLEEAVVEKDLGNVAGLKILDLGCGTGRQSIRLAARGAQVIALDQSTGMLEKARAKSKEVSFMEHNLDKALPFSDQSFDRVTSFLALEHLNHLEHFFREAGRVTKQEGFLYFTVMHPAMLLKGAQARFTLPDGTKVYPKSFPYTTSHYVNAGLAAGLKLVHLGEYATTAEHAKISARAQKYLGWPLLLTLKFQCALTGT